GTNGPVRGLPLVSVARCGPVQLGQKCVSADVANAVEVLKYARKCELLVAKISVDPLGDMCLNMGGGFYVKLGQPDDVARKMSILRATLTCRPSIAKEAAYIDLSCPSAPVWKPKCAPGSAS
ncbi:MAG: cell division protein FtsQ/DivIB, partial [Armatimonadota bacterium]